MRPTPLIELQKRLVEVGRLRMGEKRVGQSGKSYPAKLEHWRLTSRDRDRLEAAAEIYGGKVTEWDGEWQLATTSSVLDIAVVPGQALSTSYEMWGQQRPKRQGDDKPNPVVCLRRCDGITEMLSGGACLCAGEEDMTCAPTTRLSVVLTKIPGLGVWRCESKGWNSALELAGSIQLLEGLIQSRMPVRARLRLDQRTQNTRQGTRRFVVPVVDIDHTLGQIMDAIGTGPPVAAPALAAPGPSFTPVPVAALPEGPGPSSVAEAVQSVGQEPTTRRTNSAEPIRATGMRPRPAARAAEPVEVSEVPPSSDGDGGESTSRAEGPRSVDSPPAADGDAKARAQSVAMRCRDAGLDDDGRHRFLEAFSRGGYSSAKDVPAEALPELFAALVRYRRGEVEPVEQHDGTWWLVDRTRPVVGSTPTTAQPELVESGPWGRDRWRSELERVPGVGEAKLLKYARATATELGVGVPSSLDELTDPELVLACVAWLAEKAAA